MKQVAWHEAGGGGGIHRSSLHAALSILVPFSCLPPALPPPPNASASPPWILPAPSSHLNQLGWGYQYIPTHCQAHSEFSISLHMP